MRSNKRIRLYSGITFVICLLGLLEGCYGIYVNKEAISALAPSGQELLRIEGAIDKLIRDCIMLAFLDMLQVMIWMNVRQLRPIEDQVIS